MNWRRRRQYSYVFCEISMPRNISKKIIIDCCIAGVVNAEECYSDWSGGDSAAHAPESLTQVEIARCLANKEIPYITLEQSIGSILGTCGEGKDEEIRNGRVDIVVWHKQPAVPRILIEVKKITNKLSIATDADRLMKLVGACDKVQIGIIVGYALAESQDTLDAKFNKSCNGLEIIAMQTDIESNSRNRDHRYLGIVCYQVK